MDKDRRSNSLTGPRVFVAMPFGRKKLNRSVADAEQPANSDDRLEVDFDEIWRALIRPALEQAGCRPYRADEEKGAGDIRTDMFFELVTGEFVVADISTLNPNVFYELGVRHGVSPRGVIIIGGGWDRRPFDVAPDRTFSYDGALFERRAASGEQTNRRDDEWWTAVKKEVDRLAIRLKDAIAIDARTTSSPVYKELNGLLPVDWSYIQNTRSRYFGGQLHDWHARVRKAKRQSLAGDILTLSRDAPNRLIERQLRLDAARALFDLGRLERAQELLRSLVDEDPECPESRYALAKTLHRLSEKQTRPSERAMYNAWVENEIKEAIRRKGDDPEAHRLLGRIYKYRWRNCWQHAEDQTERRRLATEHWKTAETALDHYQEAQTRDLGLFHAGINVLSLLTLKSNLMSSEPKHHDIDSDLIGLVKIGARHVMKRGLSALAADKDESEAIWANAALGEVALLCADYIEARIRFQRAATDPEVSVSQLVSFDDQLEMYEQLGFEIDAIKSLRMIIRDQITFQHEKHGHILGRIADDSERSQIRVIAFRGESFQGGAVKNGVSALISDLVDRCKVRNGDLVICGARRGIEILFAEECVRRKVQVKLLLPVKKSEFIAEAVHVAGEDWEARFFALTEQCDVLEQHLRLGPPPIEVDPYERNNDWCLEMARTEFGPDTKPRVITMSVASDYCSDPDPINERGSVSHFEQCARDLALHVEGITVRRPGSETTQIYTALGVVLRVQRKGVDPVIAPFTGAFNIGRAEDNSLILGDASISRYHLKLEPDAEGARLTNLSSHPNKTFVDDMPLTPDRDREVLVKFGQTIALSDDTRIEIMAQGSSD